MLLLALALHGVVLFIPGPAPETQTRELEEVMIDVTTLPAPVDLPSDVPPPPGAEIPEPEAVPPAPQASTPEPSPAPQARSTRPNPAPPSAPAAPSEPTVSQPTSPSPTPPTNEPLPFSRFPHLANAQAGCYGLGNCRLIEGGNFRQISADLIADLRAQGYEVRSRDDLEDTGIKVYEITSDETTQYLSLLQPELGRSVYVLAAEPVTASELQSAESIKAQFERILQQVPNGTQARTTDFSFPDFFFNGTQPRPEIGSALYTVMDTQPDQLAVPLTRQLTDAGFTVESFGNYAGSPLYEVSQHAFVAYLSIVPTDDSRGTILVAWNQIPNNAAP